MSDFIADGLGDDTTPIVKFSCSPSHDNWGVVSVELNINHPLTRNLRKRIQEFYNEYPACDRCDEKIKPIFVDWETNSRQSFTMSHYIQEVEDTLDETGIEAILFYKRDSDLENFTIQTIFKNKTDAMMFKLLFQPSFR